MKPVFLKSSLKEVQKNGFTRSQYHPTIYRCKGNVIIAKIYFYYPVLFHWQSSISFKYIRKMIGTERNTEKRIFVIYYCCGTRATSISPKICHKKWKDKEPLGRELNGKYEILLIIKNGPFGEIHLWRCHIWKQIYQFPIQTAQIY